MTKKEFKKEYKPIYHAYNKKLISCHKSNMKNLTNPMSYLTTYLFFMRDYYLISTPDSEENEEVLNKISALMTACNLAQLCEEYQKKLKTNLSEDDYMEIKKDYLIAKDNFWKLVAFNMEDWLPYDA